MCSGSSGFGIGYGIGRKYRPIRVSVSVSGRNQNSGFGRSLSKYDFRYITKWIWVQKSYNLEFFMM